MKLYEVEIRVMAVVAAEDEDHAYEVASDCLYDINDDQEPEITVFNEIAGADSLPPDWGVNCLPYGGDGRMTIADHFEENGQSDMRDTQTKDMFESNE